MPLLVEEAASTESRALLGEDAENVIWWATPVECVSALARRHREGLLSMAGVNDAIARLQAFEPTLREVQPSARIRDVAIRLLRSHALRAADALQLAAALAAAGDDARALDFVCLDDRLTAAAQREGFTVVP